MQDRTYQKNCDAGRLTSELVASGILQDPADGFKMFGVSVDGTPLTTIHAIDGLLDSDAATMDSTVAAHVLVSLPALQAAATDSLKDAVTNYIFDHYNQGTQNSLLAAWTEAVGQSPAWTNREALILSVWAWIKTILTYYAQQAAAIRAASTADAVNAVTWDFTPYDSSDPNVSLTQVLATTN